MDVVVAADLAEHRANRLRTANMDDPHLQIRPLADGDEVVALLTASMRDNPTHLRAFGAEPARRERRLTGFFSALVRLIYARGMMFGAYAQDELRGVLGTLPPGACRPRPTDALTMVARLALDNPPSGLLRIGRWLTTWLRRDLAEPHWHLGPLAVDPAYQGHGVGSRLMIDFCRRVDQAAEFTYLETDLARNVGFYEKFGFRVVGTESVLGTPNWFMVRPAQNEDRRHPRLQRSRSAPPA